MEHSSDLSSPLTGNPCRPKPNTSALRSFFSVFPGDAGVNGRRAPTLIVMHLGMPPSPHAPPAGTAAAEPSPKASSMSAFAPLEVAKEGGFTDLGTAKYTGDQFNQLFQFSKAQMRMVMPDLKAAIVAHLAGRT